MKELKNPATKIFPVEKIRAWDQYTIENEPITSIGLIERAANSFVRWFMNQFPDANRPVFVFCGPGNNGGDGLAVARLLSQEFYEVVVYQLLISEKV